MGVITAHYAVEGQTFFGLPLAEVLPYVVSRTIHTQTGIFWIATAWLATGLYIAPLLSGKEPVGQKLGVDLLFWALVAIVVGSTVTGWLGTLQARGTDYAFWIGNQGLEFTSMGRVWQILLFVGLLFWLFLLGPCAVAGAASARRDARPDRHGVPVGHLYRRLLRHLAGLGPGNALLDDRVLALVAGAPVGGRLLRSVRHRRGRADLHPPRTDPRQHRQYAPSCWRPRCSCSAAFSARCTTSISPGTPTSVIALGAVFSALEVVPLALVGIEGYRTYQRSQAAPWVASVSLADPVLRRGGLLEHGRRRTAWLRHQSAGIAVLRAGPQPDGSPRACGAVRRVRHAWHRPDAVLPARSLCAQPPCRTHCSAPAFWGLNIGLAMMVFMSLLPAGIYQAAASITEGLWYARSPEVMHSPVMEFLVWMRVPGDIVFALGVLALAAYVLKLLGRAARRRSRRGTCAASETA